MKAKLTLLFFIFISFNLLAQAPFTTLVKEPRFLKETESLDGTTNYTNVNDTSNIKSFIDNPGSQDFKKSEKNDIDFFKNNSLTLSILDKSENRMSISSQVIHYKLYVANPNEKNSYRINRYNIPLLLISKLSTSYDSINSSSAIDLLDYEAAPITLRIMPSFKKSFETFSDVIYYGFYTDLRGLNIYNPETNDYNIEVVGSGGIGITYQGDGQAGNYNEKGEYTPGRYSVSAILQGATGKKEILSKLYETDKEYVTSFQSYFIFKVAEKNQLSVKIGYQYFFDRTISGTRSNFSIALGI